MSRGLDFCYIYVVKSSMDGIKPLKIGVASSINARMSALQTGSPVPLSLVAAFRFRSRGDAMLAERMAHSVFAERNSHGEWYNISAGEVIKFLCRNPIADHRRYGMTSPVGERVEGIREYQTRKNVRVSRVICRAEPDSPKPPPTPKRKRVSPTLLAKMITHINSTNPA